MTYTKDTKFFPLWGGQFEAYFTVSHALFLQDTCSQEKSTHIPHITQISPVKRKDVVDSKKRPIRRYPSRRARFHGRWERRNHPTHSQQHVISGSIPFHWIQSDIKQCEWRSDLLLSFSSFCCCKNSFGTMLGQQRGSDDDPWSQSQIPFARSGDSLSSEMELMSLREGSILCLRALMMSWKDVEGDSLFFSVSCSDGSCSFDHQK